ncbi:hypothetical protein ACEUA8_01515 [Aeromonas veronii]
MQGVIALHIEVKIMSFGISIIEDDGFNFVEQYRPFNIIDSFDIPASGSKVYALKAGDSLVVTSSYGLNRLYYGNKRGFGVLTRGNTVVWPVAADYRVNAGETMIVAFAGERISVLRRR